MALSPGARVGGFEILARIGAGGMGEVYRARDARLGRDVALKVLPRDLATHPDRRDRLLREARAAAALNHPNICTIHEIGTADEVDYIALEYIEGQTLERMAARGGLSLERLLEIALPLAEALDYAHRKGIIHRDLKPSNVMVSELGIPKVLDFGLARFSEPAGTAGEAPTRTRLTQVGVVVGTAAFMSPEQALGKEVDRRSDIFSFGSLFYELATGRPAFSGATSTEVLNAVLNKEPLSVTRLRPDLPVGLAQVVEKALRKDPAERYQHMSDLAADLRHLKRQSGPAAEVPREATAGRWWREGRHRAAILAGLGALVLLAVGTFGIRTRFTRAPAGQPIDSVAVLPFVNAGGNPDSEYLSEGLGDTITNNLSQLEGLRVVPRTLVATYKGKTVDLKQAARDLNVRALVTGRVVPRGDTLTIQAELVDVERLSQLWGEQYTRRLADVLSVQDEISRAIAEKLRTRLTREDEDRLARQRTSSSDAYQFYLKGRYELSKRSSDGLKNATTYFEQAIARDPTYALAYSGLADAYSQRGIWGYLPSGEAYPNAIAAAGKALELDDRVAEAHVSLGLTSLMYQWNWSRSEQELQRALDLDPNNADAHRWYDILLASRGRFDEAIAEARRAQALDPLSPINGANLGLILASARRPHEAIDVLKKVLEVEPDFIPAHLYLGMAYSYGGLHDLAIAEGRALLELGSPLGQSLMAMSYAAAGRKADALKALNAVKDPSWTIAATYALLRDPDQALAWLEEAYKQRHANLVLLGLSREFDSLHADPRFQDLMRRIGIPSS